MTLAKETLSEVSRPPVAHKRARASTKATWSGFGLVIAFFTIEYLRPQDYLPALGAVRPGLLVAVSVFFYWVAKGDKKMLSDPLIRLFIVFLLIMAATVPFALNYYWAFMHTRNVLLMLVAGVLPFVAFVDTPKRLRRFFMIWLSFHLLVSGYAMANSGQGPGSMLGDENDLALALNMAFPYAFLLSQSPRVTGKGRIFLLIIATVIALGVISTQSRGGFVGLVSVAFALVLFSRHRARNLLLVGVLGVIISFSFSDKFVEEVQSITDRNDPTRVSRLTYWAYGWEMFLDNPVFGVGVGNYPWRVQEYQMASGFDPNTMRASGGRVAHSLYLTLLPELGLVGVIVYSALFLALLRRIWTVLRRCQIRLLQTSDPDIAELTLLSRAVAVSLVGFLTSGAFLSVLYYQHFWYAIGFVLSVDLVTRRISAESSSNNGKDRARNRGPHRGRKLQFKTAL